MAGKPTGFVDATEMREHVEKLRAMGIGMPRIGELAGMQHVTVWRACRADRVLARTAANILAIPLPHVGYELAKSGASVALVGTQRRLRALEAIGHSGTYLAERLEVEKRTIVAICCGHQTYVTADLARRVARLFNELQLTSGDNAVTRGRSLKKGWAPPLAWDEYSIDDPLAQPEPLRADPEDWWPSYLELREFGLTMLAAADRLGVERGTVRSRIRREAA